ncbi:MAG: M48 family metalloprotease [Acidobacteria bacterium]|nr:M48 family metalloprotease [Acidobacteriota bacterium]MCB9399124.1 M48 family metalloprotease [Acidobacteriota bacterium]
MTSIEDLLCQVSLAYLQFAQAWPHCSPLQTLLLISLFIQIATGLHWLYCQGQIHRAKFISKPCSDLESYLPEGFKGKKSIRISLSAYLPVPALCLADGIWLRSPFWSQLDEKERRAVIAHECAHIQRRDGRSYWFLRILIGFTPLSMSLPWLLGETCQPTLPLSTAIIAMVVFVAAFLGVQVYFRVWVEGRADDWAVAKTGDPLALASALMKGLLQKNEPLVMGVSSLLGRWGMKWRIRRLMRNRFGTRIVSGLATLAALFLVLVMGWVSWCSWHTLEGPTCHKVQSICAAQSCKNN